jgi:hypothetical protein
MSVNNDQKRTEMVMPDTAMKFDRNDELEVMKDQTSLEGAIRLAVYHQSNQYFTLSHHIIDMCLPGIIFHTTAATSNISSSSDNQYLPLPPNEIIAQVRHCLRIIAHIRLQFVVWLGLSN